MGAIRASAPISYTDSKGRQWSIPASGVDIDDTSGDVTPKNWKPDPFPDPGAVKGWLTYLVRNGTITRDTRVAQPPPAMVLTARDGGSSGNSITAVISNVAAATGKFDAKVTETDQYTGLTAATIEAVLGKLPGSGQRPGLIFVPGATAPKTPKAQPDVALSGDPTATFTVPAASGNAFKLQAKADGPDGQLTHVTVTPGADADTFDLVATWQKTATAIAASEMATQFGYVLNVTAPPGRPLGVPAAGTVTLSGGTNPGPAGRASAVVLSAS